MKRESVGITLLAIKTKACKKQTDLFHPSLSQGHSPVLSLSGPQSLAYSNNIRKRAIFMSTGRQACCIHLLHSSAISLPISCPCWVSTKNLFNKFVVRMAFSCRNSQAVSQGPEIGPKEAIEDFKYTYLNVSGSSCMPSETGT